LEGKGGTVRVKAFKDQYGLQIIVADDGTGFSQEILENGIRPFRTSRSRGTGLGLSMVLRFVKDAGGSMKLTNHQPHGACVAILLPITCIAG
jgi:two-component system, NtrC family, sensor kinase